MISDDFVQRPRSVIMSQDSKLQRCILWLQWHYT